jgi:hypothetical protein
MLSSYYQIIRVHYHLIRAEHPGYYQIIRAENRDVIKLSDLYNQAVTVNTADLIFVRG